MWHFIYNTNKKAGMNNMNYQVMPPLSDDEYNELKQDISERGVMVPIEFDDAGNVLDGHHRLKICRELGIDEYPKIIRSGMTEEQKRTHARKLNMARRHLNREQKQELIREQLRETPERSDRQIAGDLGVSHVTVGSQRKAMESIGQLDQCDRQTSDGRIYPKERRQSEPQPQPATDPIPESCKNPEERTDHESWTDPEVIVGDLDNGQHGEPNGDGTWNIYDSDGTYCTTIGIPSKDVEGLDTEELDRFGDDEQTDAEDTPTQPTQFRDYVFEPIRKPHVVNNSTDNEWYTPSKYVESARKVMGSIDLDPASNDFANKTVKADTYYTEADDGTKQKWFGNVWLNPPYQTTLIERFAGKIAEKEFEQAIVLVNNASETQWYQKLWRNADAMVGPAGRIKFEKRDGAHGTPLQGQTFFYYGNNPRKFLQVFSEYGMGTVIDASLHG